MFGQKSELIRQLSIDVNNLTAILKEKNNKIDELNDELEFSENAKVSAENHAKSVGQRLDDLQVRYDLLESILYQLQIHIDLTKRKPKK